MKVLQIVNSLGTGGAEKLLLDTIPRYAAQGITTDLLLLNAAKTPFYEQLAAQNCCTIYAAAKAKSVYDPRHIKAIIPFLKKYDLAHVHLFPAQYWTVLAKKASGVNTPLVFTEHSTSNRRLAHPLLRKIDKLVYRHYQQTVCITPAIKNILIQHTGLPAERFTVIENGVDLERIAEADKLKKSAIHPALQDSDTVLIQVAGFREPKDQPTLIRALVHLPTHVKLLLAGDGVTRASCEELVHTLGLSERVFFLGMRSDIPHLLKSADIVVLSSHYEGLSLSSIEGMASGNPFVASAVPGLQEIVAGAGVLFEDGDDMQLAAEVRKLMEEKDWYQTVARQCVARATQYDIQKMVTKHIALYESICT